MLACRYLDELEQREKSEGMLGGWAVPVQVDDPTGEKRRSAVAGGAGSAGATLTGSGVARETPASQ